MKSQTASQKNEVLFTSLAERGNSVDLISYIVREKMDGSTIYVTLSKNVKKKQ